MTMMTREEFDAEMAEMEHRQRLRQVETDKFIGLLDARTDATTAAMDRLSYETGLHLAAIRKQLNDLALDMELHGITLAEIWKRIR